MSVRRERSGEGGPVVVEKSAVEKMLGLNLAWLVSQIFLIELYVPGIGILA